MIMIAGPILSRSARPALTLRVSAMVSFACCWTSEAKKASKMGSPFVPVPGH